MSKPNMKGYNLGKVEKDVILTLVHHGPQTINGTKRKIEGSHSKSVNNAFHTLGKKGLIKPVGVFEYRSRKFDTFWLTEKGIAYAMYHDADSALLLKNTKKVYPNNMEKASLIEVLAGFDEGLRKTMIPMVLREPNVESIQIVALTMFGIAKGLNAEAVNSKMVSILKKYPREYRFYRRGLRRSQKQLKRLIKSLPNHEET